MPPIEVRAVDRGEPVSTDRSGTVPVAVVRGNGLHSVVPSGASRIGGIPDRIRPHDHMRQSEGRLAICSRDSFQELGVLLRDGLSVRRTHGYAAAVAKLREAVNALLEVSKEDAGDLSAEAGRAAGDLMDDGARYVLTSRWVRAERDRGATGRLPEALTALAHVDVQAGWMASAEANLAEARRVATVTATPAAAEVVSLGELTVLAWRGRAQEARSAAAGLHQSNLGL